MQQSSGVLLPLRMWRERLSARLATAVLSMSLLCALLLTGYDFRDAAAALEAQIAGIGTTMANIVAFNCSDAISTDDVPAVESFADHLLQQPEVIIAFVRIERADGVILNPKNAPSAAALASTDVRTFTAPVVTGPDQRVLGCCTIGLAAAPWRTMLWDRMVTNVFRNLLAFSLIATVLTVLLRSWLGKPLRQLDESAQRIATGNLEVPVAPAGVSELLRLARTLEHMRANLRASHVSMAEQNARLREVDRLKDEFIANTSHEIRTPLSSILGGIELLGEATDAEFEELLDAVRRNGKHLLFLINQVLDFSKMQAGNLCITLEDVAVRPLVEDVLACVRPQAMAKDLAFELRFLAGANETIRSDATRLRQILINLLGNAVKFTAKGAVELVVERVEHGAGDRLVLTIADSGVGIPSTVQERLFEPFAQGDASMSRRFGGTGLGLVISRQLARLLGGDITLSSTVDVGTRVVLTLPAAPPMAPADTPRLAGTAVHVDAPPSTAAGRVLLVDDAPDNRRLLSTMLRRSGVEVATAENGEVACATIDAAAASGRPFDLVLMDIQMPVLDGHQAARRLRAAGVKVPLVALTAHATEHDRIDCKNSGFDGYATKPISCAQLAELVQRFAPHPPV